MTLSDRLSMLARAALLAVVVVGVLASGLTLTTYTLAKANEFVTAYTQTDPFASGRAERMCLD